MSKSGARWQRTRAAVLLRSKGRCEQCHTQPGEHVHHLRYWPVEVNAHGRKVKRRGGEPLEWLQHLCLACHKAAHPKSAPPDNPDWNFRDKLLAQFARH